MVNLTEVDYIGMFFMWMAVDALSVSILHFKSKDKIWRITTNIVRHLAALAIVIYTVVCVQVATIPMAAVTLGIGMPYVFFTTAWEDGTLHRWGDRLRDAYYDQMIRMVDGAGKKDDTKNSD